MKTVSKKLLSLMLVAILLLSAVPFQAFATDLDVTPEETPVVIPEETPVVIPEETPVVIPEETPVVIPDETPEIIPEQPPVAPVETPEQTPEQPPVEVPGSELTPAEGGGSPIPHVASHNSNWQPLDERRHGQTCTNEDCVRFGDVFEANHDWSHKDGYCRQCGYYCAHSAYVNGVCSICGMSCPNHNLHEVPDSYQAPDCTTPGKNFDKRCDACGMEVEGKEIPATGHKFDGQVCTKCGATARTVTLDPTPGTINGGASSTTYILKNDKYLVNLPKPDTRSNFTFVGWLTEDGRTILPNNTANITYEDSMGTTFTAQWVAKTKHVEVYAVLNGKYNSPLSGFVWQGEAPEKGNLLDYLKANATESVQIAVSNYPGFEWDGIFRDRLGNALKDGTANQAQNIYVNFTSLPYKLYFNADGGTVAPTSKVVYRGSKVGTLPTPYKEGKVFMGWRDDAGNLYTADTVFQATEDVMLNAVWKDQAKVYLRVYINGNFNTPDRLLEIDKYVVDDHISWSAIDAYLRKYYSPAPGGVMVVNGLFDKTTWEGYRSNPNQERKSDIRVTANTGTEIYVMINGVNSGVTILPTGGGNLPSGGNATNTPSNGFWVQNSNGVLTWYPAGSVVPSGNGYWVYDNSGNPNIWVITGPITVPTYIYIGSNPKTGDTAKIEIAAAIMVLAAAALVTVMVLRKKKVK